MSPEKEIFSCRQCGACCHGQTTVSLTKNDLERMAKHLRLSIGEVKERYLRVTGNIIQMKVVDGHCIFFNEGCTIHTGKPWRCTQWPLHPSILVDRANYEAIRNSCPGIKGDLSYEDFCRRFSRLLDREDDVV